MKQDNKELIERIKQGLKQAEERPYRAGAWEAYKAKYEPVSPLKRLWPIWSAAAAAALLGFVFLLTDRKEPARAPMLASTEQVEDVQQPSVKNDEESTALQLTDGKQKMPQERQMQQLSVVKLAPIALAQQQLLPVGLSQPQLRVELPKGLVLSTAKSSKPINQEESRSTDQNLIAGTQVQPDFAYTAQGRRESLHTLGPKKLRLSNRMELGAFVSPSGTNQQVDLGGGLVLAYQLNDKLAIRTGASFNQYEVGMVGSRVAEMAVAKRMAAAPIKNADKTISKEAATLRGNNLLLPDLHAVTGKVQTLDIPLEVRYNLTKQFYATGGLSYAAVLSQERLDHYEQSAAVQTYSSVGDADEMQQNGVTTVQTTELSADDNVNTNGFGGFVNFSVGRRMSVGKRMKISVEPFVKLPVGQFKQADMNYTNGGIRLMTSF